MALAMIEKNYPGLVSAKNAKRGLEMVVSKVQGKKRKVVVESKPLKSKKAKKAIKKKTNKLKKTIRRVIEQDNKKTESQAKWSFIKGKTFAYPVGQNQLQTFVINDGVVDWNWFSPARLMDGLAVCYKAKAAAVAGGNTATALTGNFDADTKFTLVSGKVIQTITNNYLIPIVLTWYEFRPKSDILTETLGAYQTWSTGITQKKGLQGGTVAYSPLDPTFMYDDPRMYPKVTDRYKVTSQVHHMNPGATITLELKVGLKHMNAQTFKETSASTAYYFGKKNLSVQTMIKYYPVLSETNPSQAAPMEPIRQIKAGAAASPETGLLWEVREYLKFRMPSETADANEHGDIEARYNWYTAQAPAAAGMHAHSKLEPLRVLNY